MFSNTYTNLRNQTMHFARAKIHRGDIDSRQVACFYDPCVLLLVLLLTLFSIFLRQDILFVLPTKLE